MLPTSLTELSKLFGSQLTLVDDERVQVFCSTKPGGSPQRWALKTACLCNYPKMGAEGGVVTISDRQFTIQWEGMTIGKDLLLVESSGRTERYLIKQLATQQKRFLP